MYAFTHVQGITFFKFRIEEQKKRKKKMKIVKQNENRNLVKQKKIVVQKMYCIK